MKIVDMSGRKYGSLLAVRPTGKRDRAKNRIWEFVCDCGKTCHIDGYSVRYGRRVTCQDCSRKRVVRASLTHGKSSSPEFGAWTDIQSRCHNPNSTSYPNYGGRGISVCERWRKSFSAFLEDMGNRPHGTSLDRIDNYGNYEPNNCRWATIIEQANNRRTNVFVTIGNDTRTISQWADSCGLKPATLYRRFKVGYRGNDLIQPLQKAGRRCA